MNTPTHLIALAPQGAYFDCMHTQRDAHDTTAQDLRRTSLKWLGRFFVLLFVTLAVWYLFGWWALVPGTLAALVLVRSVNTYRVAGQLDRH